MKLVASAAVDGTFRGIVARAQLCGEDRKPGQCEERPQLNQKFLGDPSVWTSAQFSLIKMLLHGCKREHALSRFKK